LDTSLTHYLHCNIWWKNFLGGSTPNDTLFIDLDDGVNTTNLFFVEGNNPLEWYKFTFEIPDNFNDFNVVITTADWSVDPNDDNLVEAGIDNFYIDNDPSTYLTEDNISNVTVYPNPTNDGVLYLEGLNSNYSYSLYNLSGKLIKSEMNNQIVVPNKGVFILKIETESGVLFKKVIF
jgi:hypothetical protein